MLKVKLFNQLLQICDSVDTLALEPMGGGCSSSPLALVCILRIPTYKQDANLGAEPPEFPSVAPYVVSKEGETTIPRLSQRNRGYTWYLVLGG